MTKNIKSGITFMKYTLTKFIFGGGISSSWEKVAKWSDFFMIPKKAERHKSLYENFENSTLHHAHVKYMRKKKKKIGMWA